MLGCSLTRSHQSYLVRWVNVKEEHTISWSIQPHKKTVNFGIFKHPGPGIAPTPRAPTSTFEGPPTPGLRPADASADPLLSPQSHSSAAVIEKLKSSGLKLIAWHGVCEANQITSGTQDVPKHEGGMYALVFDNTFAKSFSKSVTFVLLTYPCGSPPTSNHQVHHLQASAGSSTSLRAKKKKSRPDLQTNISADSLPGGMRLPSSHGVNSSARRQDTNSSSSGSSLYTGILQKRRRKRHQGYARRFFSLDFDSATLSYYHDRSTSALRGAVPLSLAAIGANAATREISIDSGAEVWHLKALNMRDFESWKKALEVASHMREMHNPQDLPAHRRGPSIRHSHMLTRTDIDEERDWIKLEALVARVAASRDAVRRLAMETDPKYMSTSMASASLGRSVDSARPVTAESPSTESSPIEGPTADEYFQSSERRAFWKRKSSSGKHHPSLFKRSASAQSPRSSSRNLVIPTERAVSTAPRGRPLSNFPEEGLHDNCMTILRDLDTAVVDFTTLIAESRQRRSAVLGPMSIAGNRASMESTYQEFYDAEMGNPETSQVLLIQPDTDDEGEAHHDAGANEADSASASEVEETNGLEPIETASASMFPPKPKSLSPLPLGAVTRRSSVPIPTVSPPSLIGFLRKNVGKDLSTISMPVSANEPISLLQRASESLEYSELLDLASTSASSSVERLLYVAAFALSGLSVLRVKERSIRKPFNPLLGETFELVREDKGFRFLAEKISHRPVKLASQAESEKWCFNQAPLPTQKFWGKSAELITEGRARVILHPSKECFSWMTATCFLRNVIAGEKYVEPVGTMTVTNETTREYAVVTFKSKGMFSGRSEDVVVQAFDSYGDERPMGMMGKWTTSLTFTKDGTPESKPLWTAGDLVSDAPKRYGFTTFAASLNEITLHEQGRIAPTDSRLRQDQRALEDGDCDAAESMKAKEEEAQRERRRTMDSEGVEWSPSWFTKLEAVEGEEVWMPKTGKDSYWEARAKGDWHAARRIFES